MIVRFFRKVLGLLSSRAFLVWTIGGWIFYYVFSDIWMKEAFASFIEGMAGNPLVQIPFVLFLISGYCNLFRVSAEALKEKRKSLLLKVLLPLGVMLFFTGFFLSSSTRQFEWDIVGQGQSVRPHWGSESYTVGEIKSGLKASFLDMNSGEGIFAYEPKVTILDRASRSFEIGAFPPTKIGDSYYHILNFGLAPGVRLMKDGEVKDEGYMPLRLFPPGNNDSFEIRPYPFRFLLSMEPEKVFQKHGERVSEYNLVNPDYRIRVLKGEKVIAEADTKEKITFDDFILVFFKPAFWVQLEIVKDAGVPVILSGMLLMCIGFPLYLLFSVTRLFRGRRSGTGQ